MIECHVLYLMVLTSRFRREPEDGGPFTLSICVDNAERFWFYSGPSFRSSHTQPSQMGNFKHQSLRTSDRDRDKDIDKDRERDMREKEGQERLRNVGFCYNTIFQINNTFQLSDKYDRDRLTLPGSMNALRNKQRDTASHLATGTSRPGPRNHIDNGISRQVDAKDSGKKKAGENSEDWRKGWFFYPLSKSSRCRATTL
jgi:hypothetical protein